MAAIQIQNINKSFGSHAVLSNINLNIRSGEFFFLLGPSGCGKTTLLRLLAGFDQPNSGDLRFNDHSILNLPAHKRNTAMVFQHYALWPHMTVAENVMYGLTERAVSRADKDRRTMQALARVRMKDYASRYPSQLSGGQQQRVALARALVIEPEVVLLDEPLSNLDASLRAEMRDEIRNLHDETGMTMVYVTHDQQEALSMATTIAVMSNGKVEQVGTPSQIYEQPQSRFVADFLGAANWISGTLETCTATQATVRIAEGILHTAPPTVACPIGSKVQCMVRPENMRLGPGQPGDNQITATVMRTVYLGSTTEIQLHSASGLIRCHHTGKISMPISAGQNIAWSFPPESTCLFPHH